MGGGAVPLRMERLENGCLKIVLTEQELAERRLSFSLLDYRDAVTRQALEQLLREAQLRTGFKAPGSLLIEALPLDDGCLLLVTPEVLRPRLRIRRAAGPYVYTLSDIDSLLELARGWHHSPVHTRSLCASSLYRSGDSYRLIVYPALTFSKQSRQLLETFSSSCQEGDAAAAFVAEHDTPLVIGNAMAALCRPYERPQA